MTFTGDEYILGRIGGGFPTGAGIDVAVTPAELQFLLTLEPGVVDSVTPWTERTERVSNDMTCSIWSLVWREPDSSD